MAKGYTIRKCNDALSKNVTRGKKRQKVREIDAKF